MIVEYNDTGLCIPETVATLALQQAQLAARKRVVQMFPLGTAELPLPIGASRYQNERGVFHYLAGNISADMIDALSSQGRENEFLNLGPFNKTDVFNRTIAGESLLCITEQTADGIEIRSAAGTDKTLDIQRDYFERTKEPGSNIAISDLQHVLSARVAGMV